MLYFLGLFLFFTSCTRTAPDEVAVNQQVETFAKQMKSKEKMTLAGVGGSSLDHRKRVFYLDFWTEKKLNLAEARILFVQTANDFLKQVNENEKLRPYLEDYPATIKNLELAIGFFGPNLEDLPAQYVSRVSSFHGRIFYSTWSKEKDAYERIKIETWDVAVKIATADESSKINNP